MKTFTTIIGGMFILVGVAALALPISLFSSFRETAGFLLVMAGAMCLFSAACFYIGIRHLKRRDKGSAFEVITMAGFVSWMILNSRAMEMVKGSENSLWRLAALVLPALICISATKMLKNFVSQRFGEGAGPMQKNLTADNTDGHG
jgi:hypothetical protein